MENYIARCQMELFPEYKSKDKCSVQCSPQKKEIFRHGLNIDEVETAEIEVW